MYAALKDLEQNLDNVIQTLKRQRIEIQGQILEQSLALAVLPKAFKGIRRSQELLIVDLFKEESSLEGALVILEEGGPGCIEAALKLLETPENMLGQVDIFTEPTSTLH